MVFVRRLNPTLLGLESAETRQLLPGEIQAIVISGSALRRQSSEIRTGSTNECPSGSVHGVSRTVISLPGSDRAARSERRRDRSVNGRIWLVCAFDVDCRYFGSHCPEIRRELPAMVHRVANRDVKVGDRRIVAQVEI